jgi:hypothetical protein
MLEKERGQCIGERSGRFCGRCVHKKNLREKLHFVGCGALRRTSFETSLTGTEPRGLRGSGLWQAWAGALQCANGCLDSLGL